MVKINNILAPEENGKIDIAKWLAKLEQKTKLVNVNSFQQALELAASAADIKNQVAKSLLHQAMTMAEILSSLNIDEEALLSAILYSVYHFAKIPVVTLEKKFSNRVSKLIQDVELLASISELHGKYQGAKSTHPNIDNLRKMLLAMMNDIRAVLIKLAEHLYLLRNIKNFEVAKQIELAQETTAIYAPLANRLGIGHIKWEMEDWAFRYLENPIYKQISKALNQRRIERENYVKNIISLLKEVLASAGIKDAEVTGRAKHIYSIYRKMQRKKVGFEEIYDTVAVRVILPNVSDCYKALSQVHATWEHVPAEFDDYIAKPKENGYQSIHTVIFGPENRYVEIQMRTPKMHQDAELGDAAHWIYKEGPQKRDDYQAKIAWLRQVMDWQKEVSVQAKESQQIKEIFQDLIYVFTPLGDIIELPNNATPLDFAYAVHSSVGHRCRGAKVNGKIVQLTYHLKTGERVGILTAKEAKPSRDWLNLERGFVTTARARSKILHWFRQYDQIATAEKESPAIIAPPTAAKLSSKATTSKVAKTKKISILGASNLLTHIAQCCKPQKGDKITGYITKTHRISIHRSDCPNLGKIGAQNPGKLIDATWD